MHAPDSIRLLATTNNQRGDLFTRLIRDLFFSLGYDNLQLDVPSPGREIDLQGEHRFEPRRVMAECKAHASPMGGGEINKFLGAVTRERIKDKVRPIAPYFVSLGGFTGTGIAQETESGDDAVILFDAAKTIEELQRSRVIIPLNDAIARAGECASTNGLSGAQVDAVELLGHDEGYLWVVYFSQGKQRTHFSLIHADGTALATSVAAKVIAIDAQCDRALISLAYLAPSSVGPEIAQQKEETLSHYRKWLGEECGYIQLDGLPADSDLSATKLRLEKLFVPLKALCPPVDLHPIEGELPPKQVSEPIGELLARRAHVALLATPGGGKSTLLKRLATAYSFPERRSEVADGLPEREWLPLYLRCRDLRDRAHRPILELLQGIAAFANMTDAQANLFRHALSEALRSGNALLLVDGLDELFDEGSRRTFAQNLRTFIAMFPQTALVVTSRVAGFREIAGVIAGVCLQCTLAPLNKEDVQRLCISWHVEVVANTEKVRAEAARLAAFIWGNPNIRTLVENPLLLTTLLVVKRSNGEIPPTRTQLFHEAVRVLVRTWNVEGYAPLDEAETLARLSYVACAMTQQGIQIIGQTALIELLRAAATELEAELQFAKVSPTEFIQRIEYRSSLLMQTGYQRIDNELQPVFEFRHLNFQEYLAARGFVAEQFPGRNEDRPLVEVLSPHFADERWQEVIPLAAVLAGRKADPIVQSLTADSSANEMGEVNHSEVTSANSTSVLWKCLADEVTVTPSILRAALKEVARKGGAMSMRAHPLNIPFKTLASGKFGPALREVVESAYFSGAEDWSLFDFALSQILRQEFFKDEGHPVLEQSVADKLAQQLDKGTREEKIRAAIVVMILGFDYTHSESPQADLNPPWTDYRQALSEMLLSRDLPAIQAACWATAWIGSAGVWIEPLGLNLVELLVEYWRNGTTPEIRRKAAWAFWTPPLYSRDRIPTDLGGNCDAWLESQWENHHDSRNAQSDAALVLAWYRRSPWSDDELIDRCRQNFPRSGKADNIRKILGLLGPDGEKVLEELDGQLMPRRKPNADPPLTDGG